MNTKLNNLTSFRLGALETLALSRWSGIICLCLMLCLAGMAQAVEYDLYIAGTQVTSDNANDILDNGKISYNASSKTLTIGGDIRTYDESTPCIKSGIDYLIIKVDAMSELSANKEVICLDSKKTTITGSSLLTLYSEDISVETIIQKNGNLVIDKANILVNNMVYFHSGNMFVTDATLMVGGRIWGWDGNLDITNSKVFALGTTVSGGVSCAGGTLSINNSTVEAYSNEPEGAVWLWEDVTLEGCYLKTPKGGSYGKKDKRFKDAEDNVARKVEIISEFTSEDGVHYNVTSPTTVEVIAPAEGKYSGAITIPATVTNDGFVFQVTTIGQNAFQMASELTSVTLPLTNLTTIGSFAFNDCAGLTEFTLPECITSIGEKAFYYCDKLQHLYVHSSDPSSYNVGSQAFSSINRAGNVCTLHVPAGTADAYKNHDKFKVFTKVEEYDKYDLSVAGTLVTSLNAADVLGDKAAIYDASSKTLTIGGNITVPDAVTPCIKSNIDGLTINVSAPAELSATDQAIYLNKTATITGSPLLTISVSSTDNQAKAIHQHEGDLHITDANLSVVGMLWGAEGTIDITNTTISKLSGIWCFVKNVSISNSTVLVNGSSGVCGFASLIIENSTLKAEFTDPSQPAIFGWQSVALNDCYVKDPLGGHYDTVHKEMTDAEGKAAPTVEIVPGVDPALYVAGTCVTGKNASDILGDGAASYDESTKTLTISGDITAPDEKTPCIKSGVDGLTIQVAVPAKLTATDDAIYLQGGNNIITGSKLTVSGKISCPNPDGKLNIINATLVCEGDMTGEGALIISKSTVSATASNSEEPVVAGWKSLTLTGCSLITPKGGRYNTENRMLVDVNGVYAPKVEITNGDASGDGVVDKLDIQAVVDYILTGKTEGFDLDAADLNGDDKVDAADLVLLINKLK